MGNYRFRLSDMITNSWFNKLKDMGRAKSKEKQYQISPASTTTTKPSKLKQPQHFNPRKSYYFTRELIPIDRFYVSKDAHLPEPSRKSSKKRSRKRNFRSPPKVVTSSVSAGCSCRETIWSKADSLPEYSASSTSLSSSDDSSLPQEFRSDYVLTNDVILDADNKSSVDKFNELPELELPPIITKPAKFNDMVKDTKRKVQHNEPTKYRRSSAKFEEKNTHGSLSFKVVVKEERITVKDNNNNNNNNKNNKNTGPVRKLSVNSPGVRLRVNSPKIASRRLIQGHARKSMSSSSSSSSSRRSLSDSFAVVKSSFDPQRDFRDSMVEMIMDNNIRASKDLEDLLACYLSLNSDEYHELIIKVFKQIWFDLIDVQFKQ